MSHLRQYDPIEHARQRWPDWRIQLDDSDVAFGEDCDPDGQLFRIAPTPTPTAAIAHALAHLDLGHHLLPGAFTDDQCDAADLEAERRLLGSVAVFADRPSRVSELTVLVSRYRWQIAAGFTAALAVRSALIVEALAAAL